RTSSAFPNRCGRSRRWLPPDQNARSRTCLLIGWSPYGDEYAVGEQTSRLPSASYTGETWVRSAVKSWRNLFLSAVPFAAGAKQASARFFPIPYRPLGSHRTYIPAGNETSCSLLAGRGVVHPGILPAGAPR